jgi:hypothetical protein
MENPYELLSDQIKDVKALVIEVRKNQVPAISTPEEPDRYVNRAEAREICGKVSDPTMWDWENKGFIKGYRMGNKVFYKYSELMKSGKFIDRTKK